MRFQIKQDLNRVRLYDGGLLAGHFDSVEDAVRFVEQLEGRASAQVRRNERMLERSRNELAEISTDLERLREAVR